LGLAVTLAAKKSGDFAVLSVADIHVIALTYALHQEHVDRKVKQENEVCTEQTSATRLIKPNSGIDKRKYRTCIAIIQSKCS
jgi:hypothetical protein